jgi:hypothetical protein
MVQVVISGIVQYGRFGDFAQAFRDYNAARGKAGLPTYELLTHAGAGPLNEVFLVAAYDDVAAVDDADRKVGEDAAMLTPLAAMTSHVVPGTVVEKRLAPPE